MPETLEIRCTHCHVTLRLPDRSAIGKRIRCPKCSEKFIVGEPRPLLDDWETEASTDDTVSDGDDDSATKLESTAPAARPKTDSRRTLKGAPARVRDQDRPVPPVAGPTKEQKEAAKEKRENRWDNAIPFMVRLGVFGWVLGGLIGGVSAALVWAIVVWHTQFEFVFIAMGMGAAVGFGVRWGSGNDHGPQMGTLAVFLTLFSILLAKYLSYTFMAGSLTGGLHDFADYAKAGFMTHRSDWAWNIIAVILAYRFCMDDE